MEETLPVTVPTTAELAAETKRFQAAAQRHRDQIEEMSLGALADTLVILEEKRDFIEDPELLMKLGKFLLELTNINGKVKSDEGDKLPTVIININRSLRRTVDEAADIVEDITPIELNPSDLMHTYCAINNELELEIDA